MKRLVVASLMLALVACTSGPTDQVSMRPPKGNPNAAVTVVEYADLQCPACRSAQMEIVQPLMDKYGNQIRFDFMHFPLRSIHRFALEAAEASECAADQGKFWEYEESVYEHQEDLNSDTLRQWAYDLGIDKAQFDRCMDSHAKRDLALADYEKGRELGVGGTPTFFVNGTKIETGLDTLTEAIDAELERLTQRL